MDWLVQVPLSDLLTLQEIATNIQTLKADNEQLRREITALHCLYSELLIAFSDVKRERK